MNPSGLMELAQIAEQEHMRNAARRAAVRRARLDSGQSLFRLVAGRLARRPTDANRLR
ncbi:MAG: hypothetical protein JOY80_04825 [Candidatus Dormibacteraeota bacterium]|nr:hypothetical protein [Candidatus Dormibacteraeota bacterium]